MADRKRVELPPGCMITDRRTWERQQRRVSALEVENRRLAERVQGLENANVAIRERVAEAEDAALEAMTEAETLRNRLGSARRASDLALPALRAAQRALARVRDGHGRNAFGGAVEDARNACSKAIREAAKIGNG